MSVPVTVTLTGCESVENLEQALGVARDFKPHVEDQKIALLDKTAPVREAGKFEEYKSSIIMTVRRIIRSGWVSPSSAPGTGIQ